jgi:hypothetical protein
MVSNDAQYVAAGASPAITARNLRKKPRACTEFADPLSIDVQLAALKGRARLPPSR